MIRVVTYNVLNMSCDWIAFADVVDAMNADDCPGCGELLLSRDAEAGDVDESDELEG